MSDNLERGLPASGAISMSQVRAELGLTGPISLGQAQVRDLAGRPSGSVAMSQLRGKSAGSAFTIKVGRKSHANVYTYGFSLGSHGVLVSQIVPINGERYEVQSFDYRYGWYNDGGGGELPLRAMVEIHQGSLSLKYLGSKASAPVFNNATVFVGSAEYNLGKTTSITNSAGKFLRVRGSEAQIQSIHHNLKNSYNKNIVIKVSMK